MRILRLAAAAAAIALLAHGTAAQDAGRATAGSSENDAAAATRDLPARKAGKPLLDLARRYLEACVTRDADYLAANSIDDPEGSYLGINTGPGPGLDMKANIAHFRTVPPVTWSGLSPEGYVVGDLAWFTDYAKGVLPSGKQLDIRVTLIMRRIGETWKTVHYHVSEGVVADLSSSGSGS
jgi:hypothetical protein